MNKGQLIEEVSKKGKFTKKEAKQAVELTLETIKRNTKKGRGVQLLGFGTFTVTRRRKRKGRNPQTGQEIVIPATKSVRFKAGKDFKEIIS